MDPYKALDYQRALATFARIVAEADSDQRLLQNAVAQVARVTHIRHVKLLRYRPDRGDHRVPRATDHRASLDLTSSSLSHRLTGLARGPTDALLWTSGACSMSNVLIVSVPQDLARQ